MPTVGNIKATFVGCSEVKQTFFESSCVILVSVGQKGHEGENLQATISLVGSYFSKCTILVADSLQRHNLIFDRQQSSDVEYKNALYLGDQWINRNLNILSNLTIPYSVRRWDDWLKSIQFDENLDRVKMCYKTNSKLRYAVNHTIEGFVNRFYRGKEQNRRVEVETVFNNSLNFLLEEIAILMFMLPKEGHNYIIYPNKIIKALEVAYEIFTEESSQNLLKWVHVQLKKKLSDSRSNKHVMKQLQPALKSHVLID